MNYGSLPGCSGSDAALVPPTQGDLQQATRAGARNVGQGLVPCRFLGERQASALRSLPILHQMLSVGRGACAIGPERAVADQAARNSGILATGPRTRKRSGLWTSVFNRNLMVSGRVCVRHDWA